jgi:hypothetical protein
MISARNRLTDDNRLIYENTKQWFWRIVQIFIAIIGIWMVEIANDYSINKLEMKITYCILNVLSSIVIFVILIIGRNDIVNLLIEKYSSYRNNERDASNLFANNHSTKIELP